MNKLMSERKKNLKTMNQCNSISMSNVFDENISKYFELIGFENYLNVDLYEYYFYFKYFFIYMIRRQIGVPYEFVISTIMPAFAHYMPKSIVQVSAKYKEPFVIFSSLIANPSTGKSTVLNYVKDSVGVVEDFLDLTLTSKLPKRSNTYKPIAASDMSSIG